MRDLSANALAKIATQYGNAPVTIIDIKWSDDIDTKQYADATVSAIPGKILEVSDLDNIINLSDSADSQEISVVLDDTDGSIKTIMNSHDVHKRDVWVYQWFRGLAIADRFLLFKGKISSPITWSEGDRRVSFTVLSQLEDKEVGFSPEEGEFPGIPRELIGQTWPLIFGTPLDVPAVRINKAITGTTLCGVGIISGESYHTTIGIGGLPPDTRKAEAQRRHLSYVSSAWFGVDAKLRASYKEQHKAVSDQIRDSWNTYEQKRRCAISKRNQTVGDADDQGLGCNPVQILGGEDFPRGTITLNIGGGLFTGYFNNDWFYITSRSHLDDEEEAGRLAEQNSNACDAPSRTQQKPEQYRFEDRVPPGSVSSFYRPGWYVTQGILLPGNVHADENKPTQTLQQFWADAGTNVTNASYDPLYYVVSIIPGTVKQIQAYKDFHGEKRLVLVPDDLYSVINVTYGSVSTVQVVFDKPLSSLEDQEWAGDDIYVTFESSVGPNIVDILEYLITNYSDLTTDAASFASVRTKIDPFPANFAILDRTNIVTVLQEIAFQARCSLRISNGVFYISYLPETPTPVATITEDDVENQSVSVTLTPTEDLVTKYTARWRLSYAQDELDKIVLRHNVNKYGIQEEEYEFYIYNQPDIVLKVATFWLIRKSNSWKKFNCNVFLNHLNLETFDAVTLDFNTDYVATSDVKAIIEQASFDSENQTIGLECWLPVRAGEMAEYLFAWPANESATAVFPTAAEVAAGNAGGDGIGANATGNLPIGTIPTIPAQTVWVGGPNVIFGAQSDRGDKYPADTGWSASSLGLNFNFGDLLVQRKPRLSLGMNYISDAKKLDELKHPKSVSLILEETKIFTTENDDYVGTLDDFLRFETKDNPLLGIKLDALVIDTSDKAGNFGQVFQIEDVEEDGTLCIKTDAKVTDGSDTEVFDFKYDTEGEKWGAGTAFLQD